MSKHETRTALVIGANGGIGSEVGAALLRRGWKVRALVRNAPIPVAHPSHNQIEWHIGDAMESKIVLNAARGADAIIHAVNPPRYRNWQKLVLPMLDNTIRAATVNKAWIVLPGTVYNFAPETLQNVTEDSPQSPRTCKGAIRAEMERRLEMATSNGAKVLIVRAGDYFGANAGNNWFSQCLVNPGKKVSTIMYPGKKGIGHQWAYLPDVAETMVRLLDHEAEIEPFARFHMQGHWDHDGLQMIRAIQHCVGREVSIRRLPWALINLLRPVSAFCREASELQYLWQHGYKMENHALTSILDEEPHTDLIIAVRISLTALGCINDATSTATDATSHIQST